MADKMADIARKARVCPATVSRVINGRDGSRVRPENRKKVERVLETTGYSPDRWARELGRRKKGVKHKRPPEG